MLVRMEAEKSVEGCGIRCQCPGPSWSAYLLLEPSFVSRAGRMAGACPREIAALLEHD